MVNFHLLQQLGKSGRYSKVSKGQRSFRRKQAVTSSFLKLTGSIVVFVWVLIVPLQELTADTEKNTAHPDVSFLMETLRFPDTLFFLGSRVPLKNQQVKERLEKEILLSVWDRPQVILWLKRASKYFPHVENILKIEGVPDDLKYVAVVESALRPHAGSSKGAMGFWQFLRSTGIKQGLRIDAGMDERRNLFKSTKAACSYLKVLHSQFKSWPLALAAYNMGEYGLAEEIKIQGTTDYYSLYLSLETQRYVFKIIAAKLIMENPEKYGFKLAAQDLYPVLQFETVTIELHDQVPLTVVARSAGVSFKDIKEMNPGIRGYYLSKGKHSIMVPKGKAGGFNKKFSTSLGKWRAENGITLHVVKEGEYLSGIAEKYKISLPSLLRWNNLSIRSYIHPGDRLIVHAH